MGKPVPPLRGAGTTSTPSARHPQAWAAGTPCPPWTRLRLTPPCASCKTGFSSQLDVAVVATFGLSVNYLSAALVPAQGWLQDRAYGPAPGRPEVGLSSGPPHRSLERSPVCRSTSPCSCQMFPPKPAVKPQGSISPSHQKGLMRAAWAIRVFNSLRHSRT